MLLKLILFHVLFNIWMNIWNTVFRFFYDVCMNICSVTSCEDKTIKPRLDTWVFHQLCLRWRIKEQVFISWLTSAGMRNKNCSAHTNIFLSVSWCYTWFFCDHKRVVMTHLSLNLPILEKPYRIAGRQLCQQVILIRHPV